MQIELPNLRPQLSANFPVERDTWKCLRTGLVVPKTEIKNLDYRERILREAEDDSGLRDELMKACASSFLYWINTFVWTFHQFDTEGSTGHRKESDFVDVPFITWEIQDDLCDRLEWHLANAKDILINKSRDMGASWLCICFLHWLWLFRQDKPQLLELSRTEDYVDKPGNMKALFQRHDYINKWLPQWMVPPSIFTGQKNRTKLHIFNELTEGCIDGESTTRHAASGDRRLIALLDEFAKVEKGALMRSATRDAALMRIVNSTVVGPGTEYSKWKNSGQITVFPLMWWEHPDKGTGRYVEQNPITRAYKIRSPWYNEEEKVRSPAEMAREIDAEDLEAGAQFFTISNFEKHKAIFGSEPKQYWRVELDPGVANSSITMLLKTRDLKKIKPRRVPNGPLRIWCDLQDGRLPQNFDYIFGIDLSRGQGASNSVVSIKNRNTGKKVAEWRDANTPPYEMARIVIALALWCGGRKKLPYLKWEMNGPGWDFGRLIVQQWHYPFYYRDIKPGKQRDKPTESYGWHSGTNAKEQLLQRYDRAIAHGEYTNPSIWGLDEAKLYIYYSTGGIGPSCLVEENSAAKKTHGDVVIADALTIEDKDLRGAAQKAEKGFDMRSWKDRKTQILQKKKPTKTWRKKFSFDHAVA